MAEQRLWGVLAAAVADGWMPATEEQTREVADGHEQTVVGCLVLDRALVGLSSALTDAGIEHAAFKGVANALRLYPQPAWRTYGDIDLLVRGAQFDQAVTVIEFRGGTRQNPEPRPGFVARFGKSAAFDLPGRVEIDLHRTFQLGPFGLVAGQRDLLARRQAVELSGHVIPVLDPAASMVAGSFHIALPSDERRLVPLRDLAQMLDTGWADPEAVLITAGDWGALSVLAAAIQVTCELFGLPIGGGLARWAHEYRASRRERRWLRGYHDPRPDAYLRQLPDEFLALPDRRARLDYLSAIVVHADAEPLPARARRLLATVRSG